MSKLHPSPSGEMLQAASASAHASQIYTQQIPLSKICKNISEQLSVPEVDVLRAAMDVVPVSEHGGSSSSVARQYVSLSEYADIPDGKTVSDLTVDDLRRCINEQVANK